MITNEEWIKMMHAYMKDKKGKVFSLRQDNERLCDIVARLSALVDAQKEEAVGPSTQRSVQYPQSVTIKRSA